MSIEQLEEKYLTVEGAAEYLGKTKARMWQLIYKGNRFNKIPTRKIFGKTVIKKADIDAAII